MADLAIEVFISEHHSTLRESVAADRTISRHSQ